MQKLRGSRWPHLITLMAMLASLGVPASRTPCMAAASVQPIAGHASFSKSCPMFRAGMAGRSCCCCKARRPLPAKSVTNGKAGSQHLFATTDCDCITQLPAAPAAPTSSSSQLPETVATGPTAVALSPNPQHLTIRPAIEPHRLRSRNSHTTPSRAPPVV